MKRSRLITLMVAGLILVISSQFSSAENNTAPEQSAAPAPMNASPEPASMDVSATNAPNSMKTNPATGSALWNLQDADILSIINEVAQETGKNFVVDPRVTGKITLVSSKPIAHNDVYQVFLSILGQLGYSAIPSDGVIKIVPNIESAEMGNRVATSKNPGKGDEVVVRVIPLENISAMQVISSIRPLLPQWSNVSAYTPGNVLILTGRANNLKRIVQLVQEVDKSTSNTIEVVPLKRASAGQVASVLTNLQAGVRATGESPSISIAVDERSNSIILSGTKAARIKTRMLITELDEPAAGGAGNTEVVYLRYLKAKEMAPLMSKVAQNMLGKAGTSESTVSATVNSGGKGGASLSSSTATVTNIQAELGTNALILTAPASIMQALKAVIAKLDVRPAQVLIEAIIAEIDEGDVKNLGIQWGTLTTPGNLPNGTPDGMLPTNFPIPGAGNIGIIPNIQIRAVLNVLENINGINILSTPSVMVLDNHKATIEVGQDVPEQSGSYATTGSAASVTPFNTIDRKRVSLQMDVVPQINLGSAVRLNIALKNDSLRNPDNPGLNPLINISKIKNDVIVNSDNVLVLGGLISNNVNENINKIPILGDIPILGLLFTQKSVSVQKKMLMVFIKPSIMHTTEESSLITHNKYDAFRQIQINEPSEFKKVGKRTETNILPPWGNKVVLPQPFSG